jgi:hypothetical protein
MTTTHQEVRTYLVEELRKDLIGPGRFDEELTDPPTIHYLAGILYPKNSKVDSEQDDDSNQALEDDDDQDMGTLIAAAINPSAIGMTFIVKRDESIRILIQIAQYREENDPTAERKIWKRQEINISPLIFSPLETARKQLVPGLELFIRVREHSTGNFVTVSLLNKNECGGESTAPVELCFFQPTIQVSSESGSNAVFLPRGYKQTGLQDPDRELYDLLYRHAPEYAVGHGCAAEWDVDEEQNVISIRSVIMPMHEIFQVSPDLAQNFHAQEMKFLALAEKRELVKELDVLSNAYSSWINKREEEIPELPERLRAIAIRNVENCRLVSKRINQGIQLIENDEQALEAFQLANKSMLIQRARIVWMRGNPAERASAPELSEDHRWRPFQLAFILMCLPSIHNPSDPDRKIVDLLWFPTGGGKTEAYLGLAAFTIFLRRFRSDEMVTGDGVTVLMRYTLRLLTIQQFQRAATLIMACETIRREMIDKLGEEQISLGLWVGGSATPNRLKDAEKNLHALLDGERVLEGNPYQILKCPWCGAELTPGDYRIAANMTIQCRNDTCDFNGGMPLYLVDEDIYSRRPTLLIGTVDKFARMPWMSSVSSIFGKSNGNSLPPELIIQDELHLISGPLGTLVGLYETAVDILCEHNGIPPKIIASTATIRRASEQVNGIFNRGLVQFPPPALDARDSFFAYEVGSDVKPGRLYLGIHAPGKSMKTALLRIYALLLQKISVHTSSTALRDPYWTLVGYFNSMRELGGTVRLVEDDVRERMRVISKREKEKQRAIESPQELNSRIGSDEIPQILDALAIQAGNHKKAIDVLLATNMISVGMDIDRLGLMVVTGQPKMSSEYIQATSRIGRRYAGLVVTLYNWTRPRDRSHYERFVGYHSSIYSNVEPTSVTPFASRARDRGLHGVFISLVRHLIRRMNPEEAAVNFSPDSSEVKEIIDLILERVEAVDPEEVEGTRIELQDICKRWDLLCEGGSLQYGPSYQNNERLHLIHPAENIAEDVLSFPTLNSLRDVEGESGLFEMRERRYRNGI